MSNYATCYSCGEAADTDAVLCTTCDDKFSAQTRARIAELEAALAGLEPGDVATLVGLVRLIILALPAKRDWLDPVVEREARALIARLPK